MAVNIHGEHVYYNEYEVKDFYIRFPHLEKNALFMPLIRYVLDGREVYQMPYSQDADGEIQEISFLGGLLHGYRRVRQAA